MSIREREREREYRGYILDRTLCLQRAISRDDYQYERYIFREKEKERERATKTEREIEIIIK